MKRDKTWLINEIEIMGSEESGNYPNRRMVYRESVLNLIDQLDEAGKEKLYYVLNKKGFLMMRKYEGEIDTMRISNTLSIDVIGDVSNYLLTEKEIKDYDPRYWAFAVEVTK